MLLYSDCEGSRIPVLIYYLMEFVRPKTAKGLKDTFKPTQNKVLYVLSQAVTHSPLSKALGSIGHLISVYISVQFRGLV